MFVHFLDQVISQCLSAGEEEVPALSSQPHTLISVRRGEERVF